MFQWLKSIELLEKKNKKKNYNVTIKFFIKINSKIGKIMKSINIISKCINVESIFIHWLMNIYITAYITREHCGS